MVAYVTRCVHVESSGHVGSRRQGRRCPQVCHKRGTLGHDMAQPGGPPLRGCHEPSGGCSRKKKGRDSIEYLF